MVVKKNADGQWCTYHCHGKDAGKVISCFPTKEDAEKQHSAIMSEKTKKIEININEL